MHHAPPPPPQRRVHHRTYFWRMTPQQRAAVRRIRYFAHVLSPERRRLPDWMAPGLMVYKLTITIRHSDWPYWESGAPLSIQAPQEGWGWNWRSSSKPWRGRGKSWRSRSESYLGGNFHLRMVPPWFTMARSLSNRRGSEPRDWFRVVTGPPGGRLSGCDRLTWNSLSKNSNL
ncbi:hypothetical protein B0H19DRAFT_1149923 [Mycena capillaripes]|nr:hypothetical protein B0H19DRAFT_1149923 [Mycena capillaripes]